MRTLAIKLLGLLLLAAGLLLVAVAADPVRTSSAVMRLLPDMSGCPVMAGGIDWRLAGALVGAGCVLLGLVGVFSRRRQGAGRISFRGERGEVVIELGPIEKTLNRVINTLPEVRGARVHVRPEKEGRRVQVRAEVTLQHCADQGLRRTAALVSECISEAVSRSMGLEDLATVQLVVKGVHADARAAARRLRDDVDARMERESARATAVAVAHPPLASVTLEEPKAAGPAFAPVPATDTRTPAEELPLAVAVVPEDPREDNVPS